MQNLITFIEPEEWLDITDFIVPNIMPYYMISTYGRVYSKVSNKILSDSNDGRGYRIISLVNLNGSHSTVRVHRLVMLAFSYIDNAGLLEVNHIDGNKNNNYLYNLEWCTGQENIDHACAIGLMPKCEDMYNAILTNEQVHTICQGLEKGLSYNDIVESIDETDYKNLKGVIRSIRVGDAWRYIANQYSFAEYESNIPYKFTDDEVYKICEGLEKNLNYKEVLTTLGYDINALDDNTLKNYNRTISNIRGKKLYKSISKDFEFPSQRSSQIFSDKQIHRICKHFEQQLSFDEILYKLNIGLHNNTKEEIFNYKSILSAIKNRARFKKISKDYNF